MACAIGKENVKDFTEYISNYNPSSLDGKDNDATRHEALVRGWNPVWAEAGRQVITQHANEPHKAAPPVR
jgi:hypothetical protein